MSTASTIPAIDLKKIREEFPILHQKINGRDLVYFDNAAINEGRLPVSPTSGPAAQ